MNVIRKLTWQYMKKNKRRTIVTMIGIIISVAMMTAVTTAGTSFIDLYQRKTIDSDGRWHVLYKDVPVENEAVITGDENTESALISADLGYDYINSSNKYKPYVFVKAYNADGFDMVPLKVIEGRLPQNSSEILVPDHLEKNGGVHYEVGDTIEITLGQRMSEEMDGESYELGQNNSLETDGDKVTEKLVPKEKTKTYTVAGIAERPSFEEYWAPGYTFITVLDDNSPALDTVNISVWQKKLGSHLFEECSALAESAKATEVSYNSILLAFSGVSESRPMMTMMYSVVTLLLVIIIISSVSLIYNAFAISLTERSRQLGLLAGVGATRRQKRYSVYFEGAVIGAVSIPLGVLSGIGGLAAAFKVVSPIINDVYDWNQPLYVVVSWPAVAAAVLLAAVTIFISTWIPARRASKISPIDSIRQAKDIKLTKKAVKTSWLTRKLFGFEGELAMKNLKRNKKRYRATVISLAVSVILFLSVSGFVNTTAGSYELLTKKTDVDFTISGEEKYFDDCIDMPGVSKHSKMTTSYSFYLQEDFVKLSDEYREQWIKERMDMSEMSREEAEEAIKQSMTFNVNLYALDDESLHQFLKEAGIGDIDLDGGDAIRGIVLNKVILAGMQSRAEVSETSYEAGDKIELSYYKENYNKQTNSYDYNFFPAGTMEIAAVSESFPWCIGNQRELLNEANKIDILVSEKTLEKLVNTDDSIVGVSPMLYMNSDAPEDTLQALEDFVNQNEGYESDISYNSAWKFNRDNDNMLLIVSIFSYGFIFLMTAICAANIINTTTTSISLRRREFAMLKSIGMTPKAFHKMIVYESLLYGIKALIFGLPFGFLMMWFIYRLMGISFYQTFTVPWFNVIFVIIMIFAITGLSMMYAVRKVKKENVIDALKSE